MILKILAWAMLVLCGLALFLHPFLWGTERKPYGISSWFSLLLEAILVIPLALRVLGYI